MSIRTRGKSHQVRLPGERPRTFPSRKAAREYELKRKVARSSGDQEAAAPVTLAEALDGFIDRWIARRRPAAESIAGARKRAKFWKRELGSRRLDILTVVEVEDAITARATAHPAAAKIELEWFKRALKDAQRRGQRFDVALLAIPAVRTDGREGVALTLDELQWLGSWFPEPIARFPEIVGSVGLRLGEALSLTDDRINLDHGSLFIPARMCKEGRDKTIELAGFERVLIAQQLLTRPRGARVLFPRGAESWSPNYFRAAVWHPARKAISRELREKSKLPPWEPTRFDLIVPHDLRHTAVSMMAAGGMRPEVIARRVGHNDGGRLILERYRHLFPNEMAAQLDGYERWRRESASSGEAARRGG